MEAFWDIKEAIPLDFWTAGGASFSACLAIFLIAWALSPPYYPADYPEEKKLLWRTTAVSLFPSIAVPIVAIPATLEFFNINGHSMNGAPPLKMWVALGLSLGYMAFDTLCMLVFPAKLRKALRPALYKQMMFHHLFSIFLWPYGLATHCAVLPVGYFMVTECTNIFLNVRWFFNEKKVNSSFINLGFLISYFLVRVVPAPWITWLMLTGKYSNWTIPQLACIPPVAIPILLNLFWFKLIVAGTIKHFKADKRK